MFDRELTQLISTAKHYLDAADSLLVSDSDLARTVSADSAAWSVDRQPRALAPLDTYSAHLASCAVRLATIHEILVGGTEEAWSIAYPHDAALTDDNLNVATSGAIEILLRDNAAHAVDPSTKGSKKSKFRKAALGRLTFKGMRDEILARYQALADKIQNNENA